MTGRDGEDRAQRRRHLRDAAASGSSCSAAARGFAVFSCDSGPDAAPNPGDTWLAASAAGITFSLVPPGAARLRLRRPDMTLAPMGEAIPARPAVAAGPISAVVGRDSWNNKPPARWSRPRGCRMRDDGFPRRRCPATRPAARRAPARLRTHRAAHESPIRTSTVPSPKRTQRSLTRRITTACDRLDGIKERPPPPISLRLPERPSFDSLRLRGRDATADCLPKARSRRWG